MFKFTEPTLITGKRVFDDRGSVGFINEFNFNDSDIKRFYMVENFSKGMVRAWHAHKLENKYVTVVRGAAVIGAVKLTELDYSRPDKGLVPMRFVLTSQNPTILAIPAGYANGAMSLTDDTVLFYFSTATLEESKNDDYRINSRYWNIWNIEER